MPLSYQHIPNPSSTTFTVTFEFLNLADIKAIGKLDSATDWTELPVTFASTSGEGVTTVTVADASTYSSAGAIRIYRASTQDPLVDFQNGSRLSESDLDTAYRQGLFAAQEVRENAGENITAKGDTGPAGADGNDGADGADGSDGTNGSVSFFKIYSASNTNSQSTGSNSFVDIISQAVTPSSSSSKFLVMCSIGGVRASGTNCSVGIRLTSAISGGASYDYNAINEAGYTGSGDTDTSQVGFSHFFSHSHSGNSITFTLKFNDPQNQGTAAVKVNGDQAEIVVMEFISSDQ